MGPPSGFQACLLSSYVYKVELLGDLLVLLLNSKDQPWPYRCPIKTQKPCLPGVQRV